ncbi:MAG: hypothetical protein FD153_101 [Rhodospirillaceae bacterium]|nr:MAG: hypothetical protein FD153_101 [Rhodospirillaceae bacterium]
MKNEEEIEQAQSALQADIQARRPDLIARRDALKEQREALTQQIKDLRDWVDTQQTLAASEGCAISTNRGIEEILRTSSEIDAMNAAIRTITNELADAIKP